MIIELESLGSEPKTFELEIPAERIDLSDEGARLSENVWVRTNIRRESGITAVEGNIKALADIGCTRCLEPVLLPIDIDFVSRFVSAEAFGAEGESELLGADLEYDSLVSDEIDLEAIVREQIVLNLPEQIFCREDCRGLCEKCGANLNVERCDCDTGDIDPRWAALKNLK